MSSFKEVSHENFVSFLHDTPHEVASNTLAERVEYYPLDVEKYLPHLVLAYRTLDRNNIEKWYIRERFL